MVSMVPAARRALEAEAATVPGSDFRSANRGLLKAVAILTPAGILVTLLGVWLPWWRHGWPGWLPQVLSS